MTYREFFLEHPELREELEERASILEYDAGSNRYQAEQKAVAMLRKKYKLFEQGELM